MVWGCSIFKVTLFGYIFKKLVPTDGQEWWNYIARKTCKNNVSPVPMVGAGENYPYWLKRKVLTPFLKHNKMERLSNGPPSVLLSQSLRGIKHFQDFKKADYRHWNERSKHPFSNTIKWKDCQMDPIGFCFAESLWGKNIFKISKRRIKAPETKDQKSLLLTQ